MVDVFVKRPRSAATSTTTTTSSVWTMPTTVMSLPLLTLSLLLLLLLTPTPFTLTLTSATLLLAGNDGPVAGSSSSSSYAFPHFPPPFVQEDVDDCGLCFATDDPLPCRRCYGERSFVPRFYDASEDDADVIVPPAEKRGYYEPMRRFQRGSGCSCCYFSRLTNVGCCAACSMTTKKRKRSGSALKTMTTTSDDAEMTSERGDSIRASVNCQCCLMTGDDRCCSGCLAL